MRGTRGHIGEKSFGMGRGDAQLGAAPVFDADAAAARQWMTDRAAPSPDSPDADDDDDDDDGDPDEGCALPAFASPAPADRALNWLLIHPAIENPSSRASDGHSLRAPPQ